MSPRAFRRLQVVLFNLVLATMLLLYRFERLEQPAFIGLVVLLYILLMVRVMRDPDRGVAVPLLQLLAATTVVQVMSLREQVAPGIDNLVDYTLARAISDVGWEIGFGDVIPRFEIPFPFLHFVGLVASTISGLPLATIAAVQPLVTSKASILLVFAIAATMFRSPAVALVPTILFAMSWQFLDFHSWFAKEGLALPLMLALVHLEIAAAVRNDVRYLGPMVPLVLALVLTQTLVAVFAAVILVALFLSVVVGAWLTKTKPLPLTWPIPLLLVAWIVLYWSILSNSPFDWFIGSFEALSTDAKLRFLETGQTGSVQRLISIGSMVFAVLFFALAASQLPRLVRERRFLALGFVMVGGFAGLLAMVFTVFALYRGTGTVSGGRFLLFSALGSLLPLAAPLLDDRRQAIRAVMTAVVILFAGYNAFIVPTGKYAPQDYEDPGLHGGLTGRWAAMSWLDGQGLVGIQGAFQAALPLWSWKGRPMGGYDVADFYNAGGFDYIILSPALRPQYETSVAAEDTNVLYDNGAYIVMRD